METLEKWVILGHTGSGKSLLLKQIKKGKDLPGQLSFLEGLNVCSISQEEQSRFLEEEHKRDESDILEYQDQGTLLKDFLGLESDPLIDRFGLRSLLNQGVSFLSTGERRKAFILKALFEKPQYLIMENPLEGLDQASAEELMDFLEKIPLPSILILSRLEDIPRNWNRIFILEKGHLTGPGKPMEMRALFTRPGPLHEIPEHIPPSPHENRIFPEGSDLIRMDGVHLSYYGKPVLQNIQWTVKSGDFWQLTGPNGSGKSTLLSLINGENPRAFGQPLYLFGRKKGSGESVWDIKQHLGLYSPALLQEFRKKMTLAEVLLSGFEDSIGLYKKIPGYQRLLMHRWLDFIPFPAQPEDNLQQFSAGQQRLILLIRALVKHPPLLLLDEPLSGLDQEMADYMARLINQAAEQSESTIIYVSHRQEPRLKAPQLLELQPHAKGSEAKVTCN